MRKLYLHILFLFLVISSSYYTQTDQIPLTNSNGVVSNNVSNKKFWGKSSGGGCCGQGDSQKRFLCTHEAVQRTLTSDDITSLQSSYDYYTDGGTGPAYYTYNGGFSEGEVVNVYMVYLNDDINRRNSAATFTFKDNIVGVGTG